MTTKKDMAAGHTVKVSTKTYDELDEMQHRIRKETGHKPKFQDMLDEAWNFWVKYGKSGSTTPPSISPNAVVERTSDKYLMLAGEILRSGTIATTLLQRLLLALSEGVTQVGVEPGTIPETVPTGDSEEDQRERMERVREIGARYTGDKSNSKGDAASIPNKARKLHRKTGGGRRG